MDDKKYYNIVDIHYRNGGSKTKMKDFSERKSRTIIKVYKNANDWYLKCRKKLHSIVYLEIS